MAELLTPQQREAVINRGGRLLVSAAAGSGKTKVLVDRLMGYITDSASPANIDDFLIITYTKAAAAELRGKIASKLTERIAKEPANRHLQRQMQRLYLTKISTVHSFCTDILREYANVLDISKDFRVADENECIQMQDQAMNTVLDKAYETAGTNPDFCAFVDSQGFGRDDRQIPGILLRVYNKARCQLNPDGWLDWCAGNIDCCTASDASETVWGRYLMEDLFAALDLHIAALNRCAEAALKADHMEKPAILLNETLDQLRMLRNAKSWDEVCSHKDIAYGTLSFSKKCDDFDLIAQIKAVRNTCKDAIGKKLRRFSDTSEQVLADLMAIAPSVRGLVGIVRSFSEEYDSIKKNRHVLDFGDLEHRTLDLLLGRRRDSRSLIAKELSSRFREILVDEYQDSNAVQDAIFTCLTEDKQNLFMVGDVKQSIYQFRLADPGIFLDKYHQYKHADLAELGEGRKILLSSNFRSGSGVIQAVNDVFQCCMSKTVGGLDYTDSEALKEGIPHLPLGEPEVEFHGICVDSDTYGEEADFVANHICDILDGSHLIRDKDTLRPIQPEDIVILLRSPGSVGVHYQQALEQRGIRCVTGSTIDLLQTEEIEVLRALLQIISNPLQDIPLIAAACSRVFELNADDLARIRAGKKDIPFYNALQEDKDEKVQAFLKILSELRFESRMGTLSVLLDKIFLLTNLDSIFSSMDDGVIRYDNLQNFYQLTVDYENTCGSDLERFLEYLSSMEQKGLAVSDERNTSGAVSIMSIHKSKGLEFPVVYLCGLSKAFNMEDLHAQVLCDMELGLGVACVDLTNRVRYPSIIKNAIAGKMQAEAVSEELRVLYVAMTRAKDRLIMTYASSSLEKELDDISARMDMCDPVLMTSQVSSSGEWVLYAALHRNEANAFFAAGRRPSGVHSTIPWKISLSNTKRADSKAIIPNNSIDKQWLPEILEEMHCGLTFSYPYASATKVPSKQTATQLKGRYKDLEVAEQSGNEYVNRNFRKPSFLPQEKSPAFYGTAMHAVMQYISYESCTDEAAVNKEIERLVREKYISPEQGSVVQSKDIVALFSSEIGHKIQTSKSVVREFKFSVLQDASAYAAGVEGENVLLQGVVDCAIIEDDGITVVDYKSDAVTADKLDATVERYCGQVKAYIYAMEQVYNKPVKSAYLYFFRLNQFVPII